MNIGTNSIFQKEAFVILTHACMAVPVLMRLTVTDAVVELDTAALTANVSMPKTYTPD